MEALGEKTVLLADDDELVRGLFARYLELRGFRVLQAENGKEALKCLRTTIYKPAVVILDIHMYNDGLQTCQTIKTDSLLRKHPPKVIIWSGMDENRYRTAAKNVGADMMLPKPIEPEALAVVVERLADASQVAKSGKNPAGKRAPESAERATADFGKERAGSKQKPVEGVNRSRLLEFSPKMLLNAEMREKLVAVLFHMDNMGRLEKALGKDASARVMGAVHACLQKTYGEEAQLVPVGRRDVLVFYLDEAGNVEDITRQAETALSRLGIDGLFGMSGFGRMLKSRFSGITYNALERLFRRPSLHQALNHLYRMMRVAAADSPGRIAAVERFKPRNKSVKREVSLV